MPFLDSGVAAMAAIVFTNPMDVLRTRLQTHTVACTLRQHAMAVYTQHGLLGFQRGLSPALLLQFSNVSMRFGTYAFIKEKGNIDPNKNVAAAVAAASFSGTLAAVVSNPFFLLKNKLQNGRKSQNISLRKAIHQVYRDFGVRGFYTGLSAFMLRTSVATGVQCVSYDVFKTVVLNYSQSESWKTHVIASGITSALVVAAMQPFDLATTQVQSDPTLSSPWKALSRTWQREGLRGLYRGAGASYMRFGPYCILVFCFMEQFQKIDDRAF